MTDVLRESQLPTGPWTGRPPLTGLIEYPVADIAAVSKLVNELGLSRTLATVLVTRGLGDPEAARAFLLADEDPAGAWLEDAKAAAGLLRSAIDADTTIGIHGDYDCDGVSSVAVLTRGLRRCGARVVTHIPERADGYGLSVDAIDRLAGRGAELLIGVDCGITARREIAHARDIGLDIIVIDHHLPSESEALPDALIVHPTLHAGDDLAMCATAVAAEVMRQLEARSDLTDSIPHGREELTAIATISDVMPLTGPNRGAVRRGLTALATTGLVGLAALMERAGIGSADLSARRLGFGIAPRLNAAGRVQSPAAALELLLTDDDVRARELAQQLEAANAERRAIQEQVRIEAEQQVALAGPAAGLVLHGANWHPGVAGIVAGSVARDHHRPTVILTGSEGGVTGSVRSVPGFDVIEAIAACSDLLDRWGGHSAAAGLSLDARNVEPFREMFASEVASRLRPEHLRPTIRADAFASVGSLGTELAEELARLEPCGEGNAPPLLCVPSVSCSAPRRMGSGEHVRFELASGPGRASAVAFNSKEKIAVPWEERADVIGSLELNEWRGRTEPRFSVAAAVSPRRRPLVREEMDRRSKLAVAFHHPVPDIPGALASEALTRETIDSRRLGPQATLAELGALEPNTALAVVSDSDRRAAGLELTHGGFQLVDWNRLGSQPTMLDSHRHVVALDPPDLPEMLELVARRGEGWLHLCWGGAELEFAARILNESYDFEKRIRPLYSQIRALAKGDPESLDALLDVPDPLGAIRSVGIMLRVLHECDLVAVDLDAGTLQVTERPARLEDSQTWQRSRDVLSRGHSFLASLRAQQV